MALPTNFNPGDAGHVEAHEATNIELNRVAGVADGLAASLAETIRDILGATLVAGANVTITVNDAGDTVELAATGGSGGGGGDIDASQIVSGTVPVARLGASGTRDSTTYLRGDNTWAIPSGGGSSLNARPHLPSRWYHGDVGWNEPTVGDQPLSSGYGVFVPFLVTQSETFDKIAASIPSGGIGGAGTVVRLGVFAAGSTGLPVGPVLMDSGALAASVPGDKEASVTATLTPGMYWVGMATNATGLLARGTTTNKVFPTGLSAGGSGMETARVAVKFAVDAASSWPATLVTTGWTGLAYDFPLVWLRRAAS